jgi:hypothetical protein
MLCRSFPRGKANGTSVHPVNRHFTAKILASLKVFHQSVFGILPLISNSRRTQRLHRLSPSQQILTIIISISFKSKQWNSSPLGRPVLLITPRTLAVRHRPVHHLVILQYLCRKWRLHVRQTRRPGPEPAQTLDEESKTVRLEVCHPMSIHF